jgi:ubiquinone/menaquinone biosynthesis C-methylase UbiE
VLHHIPHVEKALSEIKRVLKPGGKVMAMLYHRNSLLYGFSIVYLRGIEERQLETLTEEELLAKYSERKQENPYARVYTKAEAIVL